MRLSRFARGCRYTVFFFFQHIYLLNLASVPLQHGIDSLKFPQINYAYMKMIAFMDSGDVIIRRL